MKENKTIKVIVKEVRANGKSWKKYSMVEASGRLVDLRFKRDNDTSEIDKCAKCLVTIEALKDASNYYEYPRFYADGIIAVEKLC